MGISSHEAKALIEFHKAHGPLGRAATLGRQKLYARPRDLAPMLKSVAGGSTFAAKLAGLEEPPWSEEFFQLLGATEVVSFDNSEYEGASRVHDMNLPAPAEFRDSFDFVCDSGTLEHIFNFPQAIRNCMDMLKVGGTLVISTPANNFLGHGFYQFSPELFFRLLCPENGFQLERMVAFDYEPGGAWYEVQDPKNLGRRVELRATPTRVILWVQARKMAAPPAQLQIPQQSDYATQWSDVASRPAAEAKPRGSAKTKLLDRAKDGFPGAADFYRDTRERLRVGASRRTGLASDCQAFKKIN